MKWNTGMALPLQASHEDIDRAVSSPCNNLYPFSSTGWDRRS
jgi:hypothetical protein